LSTQVRSILYVGKKTLLIRFLKFQAILPFQDTVTMDIMALADNAPQRLVELKFF